MFTHFNNHFPIYHGSHRTKRCLLTSSLNPRVFASNIHLTHLQQTRNHTTSKKKMLNFIKDSDDSKAIRLQAFRARVKPLAFVVICASLTLDIFNVTGLTYNQPDIALHFGVELSLASWSLSAYSLTFGSFLLLAGRAGPFPFSWPSSPLICSCCDRRYVWP